MIRLDIMIVMRNVVPVFHLSAGFNATIHYCFHSTFDISRPELIASSFAVLIMLYKF